MVVLSNSTAQTLAPGQTLTFDILVMHTGCAECHRTNSGAVGLKCQGIYECQFNCNAVATGEAQLALALDSSALQETTMINATSGICSMSCATAVKNCCGNDSITVTNTGTTDVTVEPNACLFIKRVA